MNILNAKTEILPGESGIDILRKIEQIGRVCYKSEDKITDDSCFTFVGGLIKRGHEAMIEHGLISVKFTVDRGVSHELVRHRIASFAQESTRYCNYSKEKFGGGVNVIDITEGINLDLAMMKAQSEGKLNVTDIMKIIDEWHQACLDAEKHYLKMIELGASPNIARSVLNNSTKTEITVSANPREWRALLKLRCDDTAHPQMREVTKPLLKELKANYHVLFDDINY